MTWTVMLTERGEEGKDEGVFGEIGRTLGGFGKVREGMVEEKGKENCIG